MILIGERINTGFKDIKAAVEGKDPTAIHDWAKKQTEAGATYLDVNLGAVSADPADMCWMIEQTQSVVDTPISIDTNKPAILAEAIKVCNKPPLINSSTAAVEKMEVFLPIAAEHNASIIGLSMDESGSPKDANMRVEKAGMFVMTAMEMGIPPEHIFLDPIAMPMKFMQEQQQEILSAVRQYLLFSDPAPHIVCGLSNVANGTTHKALINRTFLVMAIACGMDAAICDVMDKDLVNAAKCAELIMNKEIYADAFAI
jgi:5-methyltetrahydrofolate corrinoid/iron sulfur protein methyltransferase